MRLVIINIFLFIKIKIIIRGYKFTFPARVMLRLLPYVASNEALVQHVIQGNEFVRDYLHTKPHSDFLYLEIGY